MLLGYGGRNCWCFKEWIDINLRLNGHVPEKFSSNKSFSLITGFFGANASGKTSALKIYAFISYFITNSFSSAKESPIFNDSFFDNKDNSEFYVEFTDNSNTEYRYELILQREYVVEERLFLISNATEDIILLREDNNITVNKLFDNSIKLILRNNASIISTLHQYDIIEIENIYSFFNNTFTNVVYTGLNYELDNKINKVSEIYYKDQGALAFASNLILKVLALVASKFKNTNGTDYANSWLRSRYTITNNFQKLFISFYLFCNQSHMWMFTSMQIYRFNTIEPFKNLM